MIYRATKEIEQAFLAVDLKCQIGEREETSHVIAGVSGNECQYRVLYISRDDDSDVSVRVFNLIQFPEEKLPQMLIKTNEMNNKYRFVKFVLDKSDNTIGIEFDFPLSQGNVGEMAKEILFRLMRMIDGNPEKGEQGVYSEFMSAVWS